MQNNLKILLSSSRPLSWVNTAYPFALGYLLLGGALDPLFFVGTFFFLVPYNLLMYGVNDVYDYESDMKNPRKGGVEGAIVPKKYHKLILTWSFALPLPFIAAMIILAPNINAVAILAAVIFFVVAYSLKGLRFKEIPILDSITSSLHFVGPLIYALAIFGFPAVAWPFVAAFFLWGVASQAFGAIQDIIPDRQAELRSIATTFGARATLAFALSAYLGAAVVLFSQATAVWYVGFCALFYAANLLPFIKVTDASSETTRAGWKRFLWINYIVGFIVTIIAILETIL